MDYTKYLQFGNQISIFFGELMINHNFTNEYTMRCLHDHLKDARWDF